MSSEKDGTYKCPKCETVGIINDRKISIRIQGATGSDSYWPIHSDCEWAKTIDDLDISKLERIG